MNRQNYWQAFARKPVLNYINHKFNQPVPGGNPGDRRKPELGFNIHRLVFAAACFTDSAVCYSFAPPPARDGRFGIWDELVCGTDNKLGWLGQPLGPAVHLATQSPDLLQGKPLPSLVSGPVSTQARPDGMQIRPEQSSAQGLSFFLRGVRTQGPDLTVTAVMKGQPVQPYPANVARFAQLEVSTGINLMGPGDPQAGICLRNEAEKPLDPATGARCRLQKARIGGELRSAMAVHPPYAGKPGYVYWTRDVTVPQDAELHYAIGMGPKSPARSDGVWFGVHAALLKHGLCAAFTQLKEISSKAHAWKSQQVSLGPYGGKTIRLKFVADCGPHDNSTTDHAYWSDVVILPQGTDSARRTRPARFMTWLGPEFFASTYYFRHIASSQIDLGFHIEGPEPVTIKSITVHSHPDTMYRLFERGIVLGNPGLTPYTFDLAQNAPGRRFRRIKASAAQDTIVNNGASVGQTVTLGPKDGLFLIEIE